MYITVDTETWCGGWNNIDEKFPQAFSNYIYGRTSKGDYGLPFQLKLLNEHGLKAVFFVEPLFSMRFGKSYLDEVVGLILDANQSVELHLHPEWTDESNKVIFPHINNKREHLKYFTFEEQRELISIGINLLKNSGCKNLTAFRAGSFGANDDTLRAVQANGLTIDSSYNYCIPECEIAAFSDIHQPESFAEVTEVPMTTFIDGLGKRRHTQLTACSFAELKSSMNHAYAHHWQSYVLLSHSFELMKLATCQPDNIVIKRFEKFCAYLSQHQEKFQTRFFNEMKEISNPSTNQPIEVSLLPTVKRYYEQLMRRVI
ncbi:MAG: hypothetical protein JKX85_16550 [Phycisphaeraceae bacterium]|nr:hypothetical protein [Phycisphaeraceae bacterium]